MDVLNRKSLLLGVALCMSGAASSQAPKAAPYDCFGLEGVALRSCMDLNAAARNAGNNTPSTSHDCGGMTGAALSTCRELNGEIVAPPTNSYSPGGTPAYAAPGMAPGNVPPTTNANPATGTGSSNGSNPTSLSPGSGTAGSSSGSNPTGLSGGSGRSPSAGAAPGNGTAGTSSNANSSAGGKSGM